MQRVPRAAEPALSIFTSLVALVLATGCPAADTPSPTADAAADAAVDVVSDTPAVLPPAEATGCGSTLLYLNPEDPGENGPWRIGARTVTVGRLKTEIWYPVLPGAEAGFEQVGYDIREHLDVTERSKIPDAENTLQACDCYRDAPIDASHGPYPVVLFIHGTASFRTQSLTQMEHWARRGFIVVAADHPGLRLSDLLALFCPHEPSGDRDIEGDVSTLLAALTSATGELAFLAGRVDMEKVAITGHSAGGGASAELAAQPGVRAIIPMASSTPAAPSGLLETSLFLAGTADAIVPLASTIEGYEATSGGKRLVVLDNAAHLAFSDLCSTTNAAGEDILTVASNNGICGTELGAALFDCAPGQLDTVTSADIINHVSTLVLEEHLHCRVRAGDPWVAVLQRFSDIAEIRQAPE